jgi:ribonucleoside-diphosphate reductase alpha chain
MQDLYSPESEGETAFCSLSAINVANVALDEYERVAELVLEAVDIMIDNAPMMTESMKADIMRRRSVGVGITGLASAMYSNGYDYDGSDESLEFVQKIAEHHYFYLLKASQKLSERDGFCVEGVNLDWLPVDTAISNSITNLDWESLRGKPRKHSVLVANMPTESSSLLSGKTNSLYPVRKKVINKRSRKGLVQFICQEFDPDKHLSAWDVDNITLSKYYSHIQDFTDQAISADFYFNPMKYEDEKAPLSVLMKEWVAHAKLGNKTKYYLNTNDDNGGSFQDQTKKSKGVESYLSPEKPIKEIVNGLEVEAEEDGCQGGCKL